MKPRLMNPATLPAALALILTASFAAHAQDEMPAVSNPASDMPAVTTPGAAAPGGAKPPAATAPTANTSAGTTIFGERESPIGLYITPWRDARPEDNIDRPARLLQEKMRPIDRAVFNRQVEYHEALSAALKKKGVVTPVQR